MSETGPLLEMVGNVLEGRAPASVRSAAARGALPLPRPTLVRLQVFLLDDADEEIRRTATDQLEALDTEVVREVLADPSAAAEVLAHFARRAAREEPLAERLAFHASTPVAALAQLASTGSAGVIELVLTNQERLIREPFLLERLIINPALRTDQRGRVLELLERLSRMRERESAAEEARGADADAGELGDYEEAARLLDVEVGELLSASEILGADEFEECEDLEVRGVFKRILTLNSAQKAILAMKGGREERMILVRDTNKTVALGVLKNGRLTENEVENIAKMRNVNDVVLRQIGTAREWTKNYAVITSLVNNPRTPPSVTTNFVTRLTNNDLKNISRNREVPELIRRMAKRTLETRTQPQRVSYKKK